MEDFIGREQADRPRMVVLAGPNGSGKSTVTRGLMEDPHFPKDHYVNADDIAKRLENPIESAQTRRDYAKIIEPNMPNLPLLGKVWYLGSRMSEEQIATELERGVSNVDQRNAFAAILADNERRSELGKNHDFAFETVMSTQGKLAMFDEARSKGHDVEMVFVTTESSLINQQRVLNRVAQGGHAVDADKIAERYNRAMGMLPAALEMVDSAEIYDNTHSKPVLVARKRDGVIEFPELQVPQADRPRDGLGSRDLDDWFDKEEQASQLHDMSEWVRKSIREPVEARQASMGDIRAKFPGAERASIEHGSEVHGRVLMINDVHVLQHDRENNRYVVHDRSTLSPGLATKLEAAMEGAKDITIAYQYGPDSKLVDQARSLDRTMIGQQELDQYLFDPNSRESPKPKQM